MRDAIVEKLRAELVNVINSERQVVYILVEIRKLLERIDGEEATYPTAVDTLGLYCDWALHRALDRRQPREFVQEIDEIAKEAADDRLTEAREKTLIALLSLEVFRDQLRKFLAHYEIDTAFCQRPWWDTFLHWYCQVIKDCPLVCRNANNALWKMELETETIGEVKGVVLTLEMKWTLFPRVGDPIPYHFILMNE